MLRKSDSTLTQCTAASNPVSVSCASRTESHRLGADIVTVWFLDILQEDPAASFILQLHQFLSVFSLLMRLAEKIFGKVPQSHSIPVEVARRRQVDVGGIQFQVDLAVDGSLRVLVVVLAHLRGRRSGHGSGWARRGGDAGATRLQRVLAWSSGLGSQGWSAGFCSSNVEAGNLGDSGLANLAAITLTSSLNRAGVPHMTMDDQNTKNTLSLGSVCGCLLIGWGSTLVHMWCVARQIPRVHVVRSKVLMILSKIKRRSSAPTVAPCVLRVSVTGQSVLSCTLTGQSEQEMFVKVLKVQTQNRLFFTPFAFEGTFPYKLDIHPRGTSRPPWRTDILTNLSLRSFHAGIMLTSETHNPEFALETMAQCW
ncbi:hypothetical protein U0070_012876, partial [Myodes glareolus]